MLKKQPSSRGPQTNNRFTQQAISRHGQFHVDDIPPLLSDVLEAGYWDSLIDAGCGDGSLLHALNQNGHTANKSIYGLDVAPERIQIVREINENLTCLVGSACDVPLADKSIDIFVSTQVIEHVPDDEAAPWSPALLKPTIAEHNPARYHVPTAP